MDHDAANSMKVTYALQRLPVSIFLAGPTPRSPDVKSWRPEAIAHLSDLEFQGEVLVPESPDWLAHDNYDGQIRWEWAAINTATVVAFWVPREIETMPAFTTNVEFGMLAGSGKVVLGAPDGTPKINYLLALAERFHVPTSRTLFDTMDQAVAMTMRSATAYRKSLPKSDR